jgi:hypothetical protein
MISPLFASAQVGKVVYSLLSRVVLTVHPLFDQRCFQTLAQPCWPAAEVKNMWQLNGKVA